MAVEPVHLVERAAERLRKSGGLDGAAAQLLAPDTSGRAAELGVPPIPAAAPSAGNGAAAPAAQSIADRTGTGRLIDAARLERAGMVDWTRVRSKVSEEFRIVQRQVLRTAFPATGGQAGRDNLVMITSARPGEGKSFTALNLAASIARQGDHAVLLVDVDTKHDSMGHMLDVAGDRGILDLAADPTLDPSAFILPTAFDKLSLLPVGAQIDRGPELFASKQMGRLIQGLGRRYADRLVLLDAPPCLSTTDAGALAPIVGQIVMVVEAERTQRDELESAIELVEACPTILLLLNKVKLTTRHNFGAYSSAYAGSYSS